MTAQSLPGAVLEEILTYLPDDAVGSFAQVCTEWNNEVKNSSPNMWKILLIRRGWALPIPVERENSDDDCCKTLPMSPRSQCKTMRDAYHDAFVSHYRVCRDLERIRIAAKAIPLVPESYSSNRRKNKTGLVDDSYDDDDNDDNTEGLEDHDGECSMNSSNIRSSVNSSSSRSNINGDRPEKASTVLDCGGVKRDKVALKRYWTNGKCPRNFCTAECIAVRVWSQTQAVGAYEDGTLRFIQAMGKSTKDGSILSREQARIHTAPSGEEYKACKKLELVAMDLDDDGVGCLFDVRKDDTWEDDIRHGDPVLVVLTRQEIMRSSYYPEHLGPGEFETIRIQHEYNVREKVRDYLYQQSNSCSDDHNEVLSPIYHMLRDGGPASDIGVALSKNIVACGSGLFMLEIAFQLPDEAEYGREQMNLIDRRLCLFSSEKTSIVWISSFSSNLPGTNREAVSMAGRQIEKKSDGTTNTTTKVTRIAVVAAGSLQILVIDVEANGNIEVLNRFGTCPGIFNEVTMQGWDTTFVNKRPIAVMENNVITADTLSLNSEMMDDTNKNGFIKSFILLHPLTEEGDPTEVDKRVTALTLKGNTTVLRLVPMGSEHILAICLQFDWENAGAGISEGMNDRDFDFDFDMLGDYIDRVIRSTSLCAVIVHIPTKQEISRVTVDDSPIIDREFSWDATFVVATCGDAIAVGVSHDGLLMTSTQVRAAGPSSEDIENDKRLEWGGCDDEWGKDATQNTCEGACPDCECCQKFHERIRNTRCFRDDDSDSEDGWPIL